MNIMIHTSDPDAVNPQVVADALKEAGYLVLTIDINDGEKYWTVDRADDE